MDSLVTAFICLYGKMELHTGICFLMQRMTGVVSTISPIDENE